jgi:hypothetical protein
MVKVYAYDWAPPSPEQECFGIPSETRILHLVLIKDRQGWHSMATATMAQMAMPDLIRAKERNAWLSLIEKLG